MTPNGAAMAPMQIKREKRMIKKVRWVQWGRRLFLLHMDETSSKKLSGVGAYFLITGSEKEGEEGEKGKGDE
jgi:hypothetical protein